MVHDPFAPPPLEPLPTDYSPAPEQGAAQGQGLISSCFPPLINAAHAQETAAHQVIVHNSTEE